MRYRTPIVSHTFPPVHAPSDISTLGLPSTPPTRLFLMSTTRVCKKCNTPILEVHAYELGDDRWHTHCFKCLECDTLLGCNSNFLVLGDGNLICSNCTYNCKQCGKKIDDLAILTGDQAYCSNCFKCRACKLKIEDLRYARTLKGLFCMACHEKLVAKKRKYDMKKRQMAQLELLLRPDSHVSPMDSLSLLPSEVYLQFNLSLASVVGKLLPPQPRPDSPDGMLTAPTASSLLMSNMSNLSGMSNISLAPDIEEVNDLDDELNLRRMRERLERRFDRLTARTAPHNDGAVLDLLDAFSGPTTPSTVYTVTAVGKPEESDPALDATPRVTPLLDPQSPHKNILLLSPNQFHDNEFHRTHADVVDDGKPRLALSSPMAKVNRQARVVETNDELAMPELQSNQSQLALGASESGGAARISPQRTEAKRNGTDTRLDSKRDKSETPGEALGDREMPTRASNSPNISETPPDLRTPRIETPRKLAHVQPVSSPPPRLALPSVPSTPQQRVTGTDAEPRGLGLENVELLNMSRATFPTPAVTNLEDTIDDDDVQRTPVGRRATVRSRMLLKHKRSTSGSLGISGKFGFFTHARHALDGSLQGLAFATPPLPHSLPLRLTTLIDHTRSASDTSFVTHGDSEVYRVELELRSLKVEVYQLESRRQSLLADNMKLGSDRLRIQDAIKALQKRIQADTQTHDELVRTILDLALEKRALAEENRMLADQNAMLRNDPLPESLQDALDPDIADDAAAETHKATRLKFWRRPRAALAPHLVTNTPAPQQATSSTLTSLSKLILSFSSTSVSAAPSDEPRKGLTLLISKSRSTTVLDTYTDAPLFASTIQRRALFENERVPLIITRCIEEVELRGLDTEGIYRVSGGSSAVAAIEAAFANLAGNDKKSAARLKDAMAGDINAVTSALKRYLRKLPDPLIPFALYDNFVRVGQNTAAPVADRCDDLLNKVLVRLPPANRHALHLLGKHLEVVNLYSAVNRMNYKNLSVVFAPTIARDSTGDREMTDMGPRNEATELLLSHFSKFLATYDA